MTLAILCSGQGNQHPGIFDLTADASEAAGVFAAATHVLAGRDPRGLVRDQRTDIHANSVGQILCCTQALAAFAALENKLPTRLVFAGYSVGELAAWGCAGLIDPAGTLDLAARRAAAMDAYSASDDGLAYVRGLPRAALDELCATYDVGIAIINPGDMVVIGGARDALAATCRAALDRGASHAGPLKVAVASHTARLLPASERFRADLHRAPNRPIDRRLRLLSGIDGTMARTREQGLDKLARQVATTIDWAACLDTCAEAGVTAALELGPGNALATMTTASHPTINARSLDDFRSLAGVETWLAGVAE